MPSASNRSRNFECVQVRILPGAALLRRENEMSQIMATSVNMTRAEHCAFAKLDMSGKCIAICSHNRLLDGCMFDCIAIKSDSLKEFKDRVEAERKIH